MDDPTNPPGHAELVDALVELVTSTSRILDDLARATDVPDRAAATEYLLEALYELLAPMSMLLASRDLRTATAVLEAAANIVTDRFDFAPCEVVAPPRRDPREAHRRLRPPSRPRRGART
jgi:hypothetical protein